MAEVSEKGVEDPIEEDSLETINVVRQRLLGGVRVYSLTKRIIGREMSIAGLSFAAMRFCHFFINEKRLL